MTALSLRELNRTLLARQLLLERHELPVEEAVERVGGLQAQWPPSPYVALWSRVGGLSRERVVEALDAGRLVKATLMRRTLHLVSAEDYRSFVAVLEAYWRDFLERTTGAAAAGVDVDDLATRARAAAAAPVRRAELDAAMGERPPPEGRLTWQLWSAVQAAARLVHAPASAYWRTSGASPLVAAERSEPPDLRAAAVRLVRRYLGAFGPATRADLASWSGVPAARLGDALGALDGELQRFTDERGRTLLDLAGAPREPADRPAPVRFLAKWDSPLLAYEPRFRDRILPDAYRKGIVLKNGDVSPTYLVDGFVAGIWSLERRREEATLVLRPLARIARSARKELAAEGERFARFLAPDAARAATRLVE